MKLGVFGGTFDPVHAGHLIVVEQVRAGLGLDEVLFLPAGRPWFKDGQEVAGADHRLSMVGLAVAADPHFRLSEMEVARTGPTHTVDTLEELSGRDTELYVVGGLDALEEVPRWHRPERVLELATLVGFPRPGANEAGLLALDSIRAGASAEVILIEGPSVGISSSEVRQLVARGRSIRYLVPEPVEGYIYEHGLYGALPVGRGGGR